jgi:hypothetical protein
MQQDESNVVARLGAWADVEKQWIEPSAELLNHLHQTIPLPSDRLTLGELRKKHGMTEWSEFLEASVNAESHAENNFLGLEQYLIFTIADNLVNRAAKGLSNKAKEQSGWVKELSEVKELLAASYVEYGVVEGEKSAKLATDKLERSVRSECGRLFGDNGIGKNT